MNRSVSYGQHSHESVDVKTLNDEAMFAICIKLYKQCNTLEELEYILGPKMYNHLNNSV